MPPRIVKVRPVYEGWATISLATMEGAQGQSFERLMEDHGPGVCVLPVDGERRVAMLVRQFRAPVAVSPAARPISSNVRQGFPVKRMRNTRFSARRWKRRDCSSTTCNA